MRRLAASAPVWHFRCSASTGRPADVRSASRLSNTNRSVLMRKIFLAVLATLAIASSAAAQDYKPFDVGFGFGWMFPTMDIKNSFDAGWNGMITGNFNMNEHW